MRCLRKYLRLCTTIAYRCNDMQNELRGCILGASHRINYIYISNKGRMPFSYGTQRHDFTEYNLRTEFDGKEVNISMKVISHRDYDVYYYNIMRHTRYWIHNYIVLCAGQCNDAAKPLPKNINSFTKHAW